MKCSAHAPFQKKKQRQMTIEEKVSQSIHCFCVSYETGNHSRWHYCSEHGVGGWGQGTATEKTNGQKATSKATSKQQVR
jgi:hypothetical protein